MDRDEILGAVARGWCHPKTEKKIMDVDLADAITTEVMTILKKEQKEMEEDKITPWYEMPEELRALPFNERMEARAKWEIRFGRLAKGMTKNEVIITTSTTIGEADPRQQYKLPNCDVTIWF